MPTEPTPPQAAQALPESIPAHYIKSSNYRVLAVTGAMVGGSPQGKVVFTPYVDRSPIPTMVPLMVDATSGKLTEDFSKAKGRDGIVRDFEVSLLIDFETAEAILRALEKTLAQMREIRLKTAQETRKEQV